MWKYFVDKDFDDPTAPGTGAQIDYALVDTLELIREECGFPFIITSGVRTPSHNADPKVGGKPNSEHLTGNAVDIAVSNGGQRFKIVQSALQHGIRRIGVKKDCIHLGNSPNLPQDVVWTYD